MEVEMAEVEEKVTEEILERLTKLSWMLTSRKSVSKKGSRREKKTLPLRDQANNEVYRYLMSLDRPRNVSRYVWSRNRVTITLLRWIGGRASDVAGITLTQLDQGVKLGYFQIIQKKTRKARTVVLPERAIEDLETIKEDLEEVYKNDWNKPLGSNSRSSTLVHSTQWLRCLNKFIGLAVPEFNLKLSSHSFRVNYITELLKTTPIQRVSKLVGHANVSTTAKYDRYVIDRDEIKKNLNQI